MPMLKFDWTINIPVLMAAAGTMLALFKLWLVQRDFNRDMLALLGKKSPRDERHGILGDIADLKELGEYHADVIDIHHSSLGLDRRHHARRSEAGTRGPA